MTDAETRAMNSYVMEVDRLKRELEKARAVPPLPFIGTITTTTTVTRTVTITR